ncbi:response regulator [Gorillibacterium sp. sgz5001074]|uniref:response regulator n=1 Tax=Gorillibacterium sp. sgz5001074 TaxID=3446695 RepID=UPI003F672CB1
MAKVMIVDDAAFLRTMLKDIVAEMGLEVAGEAGNGREAVRMYASYRPDLVTMDITMPEMDGIQAVQEIMRQHPEARIIMCSAMGQHKLVLEALHAGAKDFIVKPFDRKRVMESILNTLKRV